MDSILTDSLDLSTGEAARKALHDIHAEQQRLKASNRSLKENLESKTADFEKVRKSLAEAEQRAKMAETAEHRESEVSRYISGDRVRWTTEKRSNGATLPGLLDDSRTVCEWQREMRRLMERRTFVSLMTRSGRSPKTDAQIQAHMTTAPAPIRRIMADSAGIGAEWVPDVLVSDLGMEMYAARRVEALFQTWALPAKDMLVPFLTLATTAYIKSVPSSDDPSSYTATTDTTAQRTISCKSFAVRCQVDEDATEDSIVPLIPTVRASIVSAFVDGMEDGIINGDAATSHQDDIANWNPRSRWTVGAVGPDHRHAFTGLRGRAADVSATTDQSGAKTYAGFLTARSNLDSPHGVAGDLICVTSPEYYLESMLGFDEVTGLEKYGSMSPLVSGELAKLGGVPIVVSDFVTNDYNASGLYDNVTTNTTGFLLFNRARFFVGTYKAATVELDKNIRSGVIDVVGTMRKTFFHLDSATKKNAHWSYNL